MIWVFGLVSIVYFFLILFLLFGFGKVKTFNPSGTNTLISFSIVIPYRNESRNLKPLLTSLAGLNYPFDLFEILLVNDASEDNSEGICQEFLHSNPQLDISLLNSENGSLSPKKRAIEKAITASKFEYIITTDADCTLPQNWLRCFSDFIDSTNADLVAGPVVLRKENGFLNSFQELDFLSLQSSSIGAFGIEKPLMCNGANLCYLKADFMALGGFSGNDIIASGDDIFLLGKFLKNDRNALFLKCEEAIVTTAPQPSLQSLFSQRIRWAAKTAAYEDAFAKGVGISVFLMNFLLVVQLLLFALGYPVKQVLFFSFLLKFNADFMLIFNGATFFGRERTMKSYLFASLLYPFFCSMVAILSLFSGYTWKGRKFRK